MEISQLISWKLCNSSGNNKTFLNGTEINFGFDDTNKQKINKSVVNTETAQDKQDKLTHGADYNQPLQLNLSKLYLDVVEHRIRETGC